MPVLESVAWIPHRGGSDAAGNSAVAEAEVEQGEADALLTPRPVPSGSVRRRPVQSRSPAVPTICGWSLDARSTRKATLALTGVPPNRVAAHVELGRGGGDTILLGRQLSLTSCGGLVRVRYYALTVDGISLSMGLALGSPGTEPQLISEPSPVVLRQYATHSFEFGEPQLAEFERDGIDTDAVDRMMLIIVTDSREGFIVIQGGWWQSSG